jgi:hypothetical protein
LFFIHAKHVTIMPKDIALSRCIHGKTTKSLTTTKSTTQQLKWTLTLYYIADCQRQSKILLYTNVH